MLPLLEVAVSDGWRNRYMAPFYALIISFALVLLASSLLKDPSTASGAEPKPTPATQEPTTAQPKPTPTTQEPTTAQPKITFFAENARTFPGAELTVVHGDEQQTFEDLRDPPELPVNEKYAICAVLYDDWTAVGAIRVPGSRFSCWGPFDLKSGVTSVLRAERSK